MSRDANLGLIADDFTGALDAGAEFVRAGLEATLCLQPTYSQPSAVQLICTDSREVDATLAEQRAMHAAAQLQGRRIFKKIDSTMRGHVGAEIAAILGVVHHQKAVVCPAVIEAGRVVEHGSLLVNGVPLHATAFANDPYWPATTAHMAELLGRPATHLPLAIVRRGAAELAQAIAGAPDPIVTVDACTQADLATIGQAVVAGDSLACGALGLAREWAGQLSRRRAAAPAAMLPNRRRPVLVMAGSRHPKTIAQANALIAEGLAVEVEIAVGAAQPRRQLPMNAVVAALAAGQSVVVRPSPHAIWRAGEERGLVEQLAVVALHACLNVALGGLVLTGGETAGAICRHLDIAAIQIAGEVEVGVPWGWIDGGSALGLPLVTKAGGFGQADVLSKAVAGLSGQQPAKRS